MTGAGRAVAVAAAVLAAGGAGCGGADDSPTTAVTTAVGPAPSAFAPVDAVPPDVGPSPAELAAALRCDPADGARRTPVLLVHGTGVTPGQNFGWGWTAALARRGIPHCTLALPHQGLGDVQVAGEYVAAAIRAMSAGAGGRRVSIVGHSQGGMVPRWALRFFSDTRGLVDDLVAIAPDNHGVPAGDTVAACRRTGCPPATLQQAAGSRFLAALNSRRETFAGVSYTTIRTRADEVLTPGDAPEAEATSTLRADGGRIANVVIQDVCPADESDHRLVGTASNTAFALAVDALDHDGPADPARARRAACASTLLPGVDEDDVGTHVAALGAMSAADRAAVPIVWEEPPLRPYVLP